MELFDSHFHFSGKAAPTEYFRNAMAEAAAPPQSDAGVPETLSLMAVGGDFNESSRSQKFAQAVESAYCAIGVHPHCADNFLSSRNDFSVFRGEPKLKAVGELGLDYFYDSSSRAGQREVFERFLELALAWKLPAIIHLRDRNGVWSAYEDGLAMLTSFATAGGSFVVHCFSGTPAWAEKFLSLGAFLGVTGLVTFKHAENVRETLSVIPDDRLLIETDSPYLAPEPRRGIENNPGLLALIASRVAAERRQTFEQIARLTTENAHRFFHIEVAS